MKSSTLFLLLLGCLLLTGCNDDDDIVSSEPNIDEPASYTFTRGGESTVSFSGQTERIAMAGELTALLNDPTVTDPERLLEMWRNEGAGGEDVTPFADAALNASTKSIRSKVAASRARYFDNATETAAIRDDFEGWIRAQVNDVFVNREVVATPGVAGQILDGSRVRYVDGQGLEINQVFAKSLIGGLMVDQIVSNYLSPLVLDEAGNRAANDGGLTEDGQPYTTMEHKWDEAYGYLFGGAPDDADPLATLGQDDNFLNKYLSDVNGQEGQSGIADRVFAAYKRGRAAIVAGAYETRERQAEILRTEISRIVAIRAIFYLEQGAERLEAVANGPTAAFHALSEGYGFIYSLQFTTDTDNDDAPYFDRAGVQQLLDRMLGDGDNGLWDVTPATLRAIAADIDAKL